MVEDYYLGDIIQTKRFIPGSNQWEIIRVGMDFKMSVRAVAE